MRNIQTIKFRLGGVWQLGFKGLTNKDIQQLNGLTGFRFNPEMRLWHVAHHANTLNYLNNSHDEVYYFLEDKRDNSEIQDIDESKRDIEMRITFNRITDRMIVWHTFHSTLYSQIRAMKGTHYDKTNRNWVLKFSEHYEDIKQAALSLRFSITEEEEEKLAEQKTPIIRDRAQTAEVEQRVEHFSKELFIRNRSRQTIASYCSYIRIYLNKFKDRDLQDIPNDEIRNYLYDLKEERSYSFSTMNIHISAIKVYYKYTYQIGFIVKGLPELYFFRAFFLYK